jgi:signal transduction histidine kinase
MKDKKLPQSFQVYLDRAREIINERDSQLDDLLSEISSQLDIPPEQMPHFEVLSSLFLSVHRDKEICERKLRDVSKSYDEVLGLITHEFKNILTSIHGYNMLLETRLENGNDPQSLNDLHDSDRLTRQLFYMTDSLLKMSLGEKGLIKPELKLVDFLEDIIEPLKRDLSKQLNKKQMQLILTYDMRNVVVECDEGLMDIVVRNLLLNAVKYGKQNSEIHVTIRRTKKDFVMSIRNYSDEIPADICTGIFEKFKSKKIGLEKGGTGIGLYNVKNIIHLHHGKITCKSSAGKWIEFHFTIPQNI